MTEAEVMPPEREQEYDGALGLVAAGATLMRIENETMMSVAIQRPRDEDKILAAALKELDRLPELADRCFYSIPYKDRSGDSERTTYVTGSSIHAARNLARRWGNCSSKTILSAEDEEKVILAGVFVDYETNVKFESVFTVPKWQHRKRGAAYKLSNEKLAQAVQAGASKAQRNAILAGLPDWLTQSYYKKARQLAGSQAKQHESKILEAFLAEGVTREMLATKMGKPLAKLSEDDLANLRGMLNALRDGEATVESLFSQPEPEQPEQKSSTIDDVLKGGATVTGGTESNPPPMSPESGDTTEPGQAPVSRPASGASTPPASAGSPKRVSPPQRVPEDQTRFGGF